MATVLAPILEDMSPRIVARIAQSSLQFYDRATSTRLFELKDLMKLPGVTRASAHEPENLWKAAETAILKSWSSYWVLIAVLDQADMWEFAEEILPSHYLPGAEKALLDSSSTASELEQRDGCAIIQSKSNNHWVIGEADAYNLASRLCLAKDSGERAQTYLKIGLEATKELGFDLTSVMETGAELMKTMFARRPTGGR